MPPTIFTSRPMARPIMSTKGFSLVILTGALVALSACGGAQRGAETSSCPTFRAELDEAAQARWAVCAEDGAYPIEDCQRALSSARSLTPEAVESAQRCVLRDSERMNGQLAAEALNQLVADDARGEAAVMGLGPHFREETHAASFSSVISTPGQHLIADHLGALDDATQLALVRMAFSWGLDVLASRGVPFIEDREALADVLAPYARQLDPRAPADETQRFALVVSGEWGADDVLYCYEGRTHACQQWTGTSPLSLLPLTTDRRTSSAVSRAAEQLSSAHDDPEAVAGVTQFLSQSQSPNGQRILQAMVRSIASPRVDEAYRRSLADATTAEMCSTEGLPLNAAYAGTGAQDEAADEPWSLFIANCNTTWWRAEDRMRALALGSQLHIHSGVREAIARDLHSELEEASCAQQSELLQRLSDWRASMVPMSGLVATEFATRHTSCAEAHAAAVRRVARDDGAHPEARLPAITYLARNGDTSSCSLITQAASWNAERTGTPVGRWVSDLRNEAERACAGR